jgi:LPPG:FO 2-phospho-L-lactate transferase
MAALEELGGQTWFQLGDRDLALHVERTWRLNKGETLSVVTDSFRRRLDLATRVLPMSDDSVSTQLLARDGEWLDFQEYFVRRRCEPIIERIRFFGSADARPTPGLLPALASPTLRAVVICPSNPLISIDPILAVPGIRTALRRCAAPVVAVSPLIGGQAVKGPTTKLMQELRLESTSAAVAERYADFIDAWVVDEADAATPVPRGMRRVVAKTLMVTLEDRERIARVALDAAEQVRKEQSSYLQSPASSWTFWM